MSTSVHEAAESWTAGDLVDSSALTAEVAAVEVEGDPASPVDGASPVDEGTPWVEMATTHRDLASRGDGLPSRGLVALSAAAAAACVVLDLWLTSGRLTFFFDLSFVVVCLVAAMSVRPSDLFTAGVLPPLLFAGVIAVVSLAAPAAFQPAVGVDKVFLTGLATHAFGLVAGYAVALLTLAARAAAPRV